MYAVILLIFMIRTINQWQRNSLSFAYGFEGIGLLKGDKKFEIAKSYPELNLSYGLVSGFVYTIPYSIMGLFMGALADKYNRKVMLSTIIILASFTQVLTGVVDSFFVLCGMRVLHGCFNSATNPLAYSLVSDIIPPN